MRAQDLHAGDRWSRKRSMHRQLLGGGAVDDTVLRHPQSRLKLHRFHLLSDEQVRVLEGRRPGQGGHWLVESD